VVEDHALNQRVILSQLHRLGVTADVVSDGVEALAALGRDPYGLVLMDCHMPNLDGVSATKLLREREGPERTPVVALTASALADDRALCLAAGMDDFLTKPVQLSDLVQILDRWLPLGRQAV